MAKQTPQNESQTADAGDSRKLTRSPNYPAIALDTALGYALKVYEQAQRHPVPVKTVVEKYWEMRTESSYAQQVLAAVKSFGLLAITGKGDGRMASVTAEAAKIVSNHSDRAKLLKQASLMPQLHAELWQKWGGNLPPNETMAQYLVHDREPRFNTKSVGVFLQEFRATIAFAGLDSSDTMSDEIEPPTENGSEGAERKAPAMVAHANKTITAPLEPLPPDGKQEVFVLDAGNIIVRWPHRISNEEIKDVEDWFPILLRKLKRSVKAESDSAAPASES